ncbi:MAG: hypothetical protein Aurels2KO_32770 [Aureliella sp.]
MGVLKWKASNPACNPFEALVGDMTEYCVHQASCGATEDHELRAALLDVISKSLSFAPANVSEWITRLLFLWDVVYSEISVVYTDDAMEIDASQVTSCTFGAIEDQMQQFTEEEEDEWEQATEAMSRRIRGLLADLLASTDLSALLKGISVFYSDDGRGDMDEFVAQKLIAR